VLGGVYVLAILYLPGGLMSIPERVRHLRAHARGKAVTVADGLASKTS
jgi:hypothetical protein